MNKHHSNSEDHHNHGIFMRLYQLWIIPLTVILAVIFGLRANRLQETKPSLQTSMFEDSRLLLDTVVSIKLFQSTNENNLDKAFSYIEELNKRISRYVPGSEIQFLNDRSPSLQLSEDVWKVINKSLQFAKISNGTFDPTVGALVDLWAIGTADARVPTQNEIENALKLVDYRQVRLVPEKLRVEMPSNGIKLDLGGISKGWIADMATAYLMDMGESHILLDIGGNIRVAGGKSDKTPFQIGIQDPLAARGVHMGIFTLSNGSLVSSGSYERFFDYNGRRYHHILDTQTGYPVDNNVLSVTVLSPKAIDGDALSTTLFTLGLDEGMKLINSFEDVEAIFVTGNENDKTAVLSPGAADIFELTNSNFNTLILQPYRE